MESFYRYVTIASISITILFIFYLILFKRDTNFKQIRIYLVSSLVFSLLLPFNQAGIDLPNIFNSEQEQIHETKALVPADNKLVNNTQTTSKEPVEITTKSLNPNSINIKQLLQNIYLVICIILIIRILFSVLQIVWYYLVSEKKKQSGFTIIYLTKNSISFSFFNLIFISKLTDNENIKQIIEHEKVHAKQKHTIDLLLTELLVAAMWFNPFIWMYKKALQQVHEFLADEGVLNSGVDQLEYQSLLVNQAAEGRLVAVSSNFSYSLIKKRIKMMTENKTHGSGKKIFVIIPVILSMILAVSIFYQPLSANPKNERATKEQKSNPVINNTQSSINDVFFENDKKYPANEHVESISMGKKVAANTKTLDLKANENKLIAPEDTTPTNKLVAAVSPTKMNVFYLGLDNPVSIGVTGANMSEIVATIDNGTIEGSNGTYMVRVRNPGFATVTIRAGNEVVAKNMFRVKRVPDPVAMVGNTRGGTITKEQLINAKGIRVVLINFDWDMKFEIVSFNISAQAEGGFVRDAKANGNTFTNAQLEIINGAPDGRKIYIEDIKAKGPDGVVRSLGSLTYLIKE